jgi:lactate racemase
VEVKLKYGDGFQTLRIPDKAHVEILQPASVAALPCVADALEEALHCPLSASSFDEMVRAIRPRRVAIAVPDETRPTPVKAILPILLQRLRAALPGPEAPEVTVIIAAGLHKPADGETQARIVPPGVASGCRVVSHDARGSRMVDFGVTSRGTPVRINAEFAEADLRVVIGQIDPHQFVGFTGGSKGAVVGCAAAETIERSHSLLLDARAQVGRLDGNPAREDMNEAGQMVGVHLAVNVVLDPEKRVVQLLAGDPMAVLRAGAQTCASVYGVSLSEPFDMVIASCGGYPKDICLYQAQKGLNQASHAVKRGGRILLLAACPQGVGDDMYFDYVCQFATPQELLEDFRRIGFRMGAHKAYLFGLTLSNFDVAVASELDPGTLKTCHLQAADPDAIVKDWVGSFQGHPRVAVIPNANTTYFYEAT